MTNHPNRSSYNSMIARLVRLSASPKIDRDCRRLIINAYQCMMAARDETPPTHLWGWRPDAADEAERKATIEEWRRANMGRAKAQAERVMSAWGL